MLLNFSYRLEVPATFSALDTYVLRVFLIRQLHELFVTVITIQLLMVIVYEILLVIL